MDVSVNTNSNAANQQLNNTNAGVAAPQTQGQRADQAAERVVATKSSASLENDAQNLDQKKFDLIKKVAAQFSVGDNPFLNDVKFTVYNNGQQSTGGEYVIRFTDLSTGQIDVKSEVQLLGQSAGGDLVSGNV